MNSKSNPPSPPTGGFGRARRIYFDYAATTPLRKEVLEAMRPFLTKHYGNPSSIYLEGRLAKTNLENSRKKIAEILEVTPEEIIFTNGGTESINLAIWGISRQYKNLFKKPRLITSKIEHPAVLETMKQLAREGCEVIYLNVDKFGLVRLSELKKFLNQQTILVSIMSANNEIGTIEPIKEISRIIKKFKSKIKRQENEPPFFHTDACQAAGFLDIRPRQLGLDLMSLNGSKIYGPKASGMLYLKEGIKIEPLIFGGGQEKNLRSGTENVASWIGFVKALELAQKEKNWESRRLIKLRDYLIKNLLKIPKTFLNGHPKKRLPNNVNITILNIEGEALILHLDRFGISASTGSACHSKILEPSPVLQAIGLPRAVIHGSLRLTLGKYTFKKEIDELIKILPPIVENLRKFSPVSINLPKFKKF